MIPYVISVLSSGRLRPSDDSTSSPATSRLNPSIPCNPSEESMRSLFKALLALSVLVFALAVPALAGVPKVVFIDEFGYYT
jgi:hypothetical protein